MGKLGYPETIERCTFLLGYRFLKCSYGQIPMLTHLWLSESKASVQSWENDWVWVLPRFFSIHWVAWWSFRTPL